MTKPAPKSLRRAVAALALLAFAAPALGEETILKTHGISTFGDLKYPADFAHLDYVNPEAPKGGEVSIWAPGTFDSMNPYTVKGRAGALSNAMFESVLIGTADEIGSAYCLMCTEIEYPESRDWVIFHLRDDIKFSDGSPLAAEDILFTYELFLDQGLPSYRQIIGGQVKSVELLSPLAIKFTFKPEAARREVIQQVGGLPVFSKAWYEENGARLDESRMEPGIGTGPYMLDNFEVNTRVVYKQRADYWGADHPLNIGQNNYDAIRIEYFADRQAAFEGFKAGIYNMRPNYTSRIWATGYDFPAVLDGTVIKGEFPKGNIPPSQNFAFNLERPQFQDPRVREAIGLMFNYEWTNASLLYGLYDRITSFWENSELAAHGVPSAEEIAILQPLVDDGLLPKSILTDEAVSPQTFSETRQLDRKALRAASLLLDEAGWPVGDDGMRRNAAGETLKVEFLEDSPTFDRVINPFVENLRALGVEAKLSRVDPAQFTDRERGKDFDIITTQFPGNFEPGDELRSYFGSNGAKESTFNAATLQSPAVDHLIEAVVATQTKPELHLAVRVLDRVLRAERFVIPQWYNNIDTIAYYSYFEHPENLPPYDNGILSFWWINPERQAELRAAGKL